MVTKTTSFSRAGGTFPSASPAPTSGFTLIEVLVVLAIVAVLATLAVPRYLNQVEASREAVLLTNLRATREVIERFYGDLGRYPDSLDELVQRRYLRTLPVDPMTESAVDWRISEPPAGYAGKVYDLHSSAQGRGRNGKAYTKW